MAFTTHLNSALLVAALLTGLSTAASARRHLSASANSGRYSVQLESYGRTLPTYSLGGATYVEGRYGEHYAVRVFNHTNRRIEAVVTVDGRDVVSGRRGNYRSERGYVIPPYGSVRIEGFRQSLAQVAAFRFTEVHNSYAARMGDARNVGVIGVAVFEERVPWYRRPRPRPITKSRRTPRGLGTGAESKSSAGAPSAGAPPAEADASDCLGCYRQPRRRSTRQGLGTGYGRDTYSPASETRFVRRTPNRPNGRMAVYYDDRQGLINRGVIVVPPPYPYEPAPHPDPFPQNRDPRFAPPPPAHPYE